MGNYKPDYRAWARFAHSSTLGDATREVAERGKAHAEAISPRRSGDYAESFEVEAVTVSFNGLSRASARLINDSDHAAAVEFGNRQTPQPHRVLGRTAEFLGGDA